MNAGKSMALLQVAHNYEEQGMNVVLFTSDLDNRLQMLVFQSVGQQMRLQRLGHGM